MGIFELFGKKALPLGSAMYNLKVTMHPIRLPSHQHDFVDLEMELTNNTEKELLTSVVLRVPSALGFDGTALSHEREIRLGMLQPLEKKHLKVRAYSTQRTPKGNYPIEIFAISHYRDYAYIINEVKKRLELRVV